MVTQNAQDTKDLGKKIGSELKSGEAKVIALTGDLGSGKTTFVQGLAEGLGIKQRIVSPTFIILRHYNIPTKTRMLKFSDFYHIDLYRLEDNVEKEMRNLGTDEIFVDSGNIVVIEWAEKGKGAVPKDATWIKFKNLGNDKRKIEIVD